MINHQNHIRHLNRLFALDLGTTKFVLAALTNSSDSSSAAVVDAAIVPAQGMRRGMLSNLDQAKVALVDLIQQAEKRFKTDITRVVVGVAGSHLDAQMLASSVSIQSGTITTNDIAALVHKVESSYQHHSRELLHAVPISYQIDGRERTDSPVGFGGKTLQGDFFLIDASKQYMKDIVELCNSCGLQVVRLYSEPFASASVTVPDTHKQLGVALADIGGGTTDGIVFKNGRPAAAFTVNVAGKLMTNDIAIGLNINFDEAEQLKLRFGIKPRPDDICQTSNINGEAREISGRQVVNVLMPRVHELGILLAKQLIQFKGHLGAGLLLTGGGAGVHGITDYFEQKMRIPVSRAKPILAGREGIATESVISSPHPTKLATVIGLLNLELCRLEDIEKNRKLSWTNRYIGQFINWIKELS